MTAMQVGLPMCSEPFDLVLHRSGKECLQDTSQYTTGYADGNKSGYAIGYTEGNASGYAIGVSDDNASGIAYVQANPSTYSLYTETEKNTSDTSQYTVEKRWVGQKRLQKYRRMQ